MGSFRSRIGALRSPIAPLFLGFFPLFGDQYLGQRRATPCHLAGWYGYLTQGARFQGDAAALEPASSSTMDRQKMRDWGMLILGMRSFKPWAKESLGLMKMPVKL